ncbi:hypothetical protein C3747_145g58 [Trypanosoma cruzi]|uniref:Uncharacterized protein n=2 Tax=Trypanosoma cruzi TaxID=5693 RepID=Q4DL07_TRYCC|nr:hypothetical protein, conserved [Trypanosoma cruzi]EAN93214.1 hypothetical protein, conserved [Trypanosoma cruzi]PWV04733.1 hypothetical protein C3747_145g58 [Trypanosoma cruzi]RNC43541.1 hypothetical protein TcCL_NonESM06783 [Trypanosoma cruzi]|eukprot:XP_815065.1 hypothetical protein [Trypanosoma cruzi strain CL Brener]
MSRKREREEGDERDETCRVYLSCGGWNTCVRLYRPIAFDTLDEDMFPGLAFFFAPRVVGVINECHILSLSEVNRPCDHLIGQRLWLPCKYHGPFRCSCHTLEKIARGVLQLERELLFFPRKLTVLRNNAEKHENAPFIHIDTLNRTATVYLSGLPLPKSEYGSISLHVLDDERSITRAIAAAFSDRDQVTNGGTKCVLCGLTTNGNCSVCRCWVCKECDVLCCLCGKNACKACVVDNEENARNGGVCCFNCYSL